MKMKKTVIFLLICCVLMSISASAADDLLVNGELAGKGAPDGWAVMSYLPDHYTVTAEDGTVTLTSSDSNDLRLFQTVEVEENTNYVFSAEVSAQGVVGGRGATLSIDNFSIDGCYIYSKSILGSSDWVKTELVFRTGEGQTRINPSLRLGGYSEMSKGSVLFRSVRLERAEDGVPAVSLQGERNSSYADPGQEELSQARKIQLKSYLHLFIVVALFSAVVMLFGVYRNRETLGGLTVSDNNRRRFFILAVMAGFILRTILASAWGGHDSDMSCWKGWGSYIAENGPATFYTAAGHEWYDYPPAYMLVLGLIAKTLNILSIGTGTAAATFAYMLPAYAADIASAVLIMRIAKKKGFSNGWQLLLGCICIFDPAIVMLSGAWGQIDSILTFFLLACFVQLTEGRRIAAGALYGLAIMIKWQALIYGPVLAAAYLLHIRSKKDVLATAGGVAAALGVIALFSLPFKGDQNVFWIVNKFFSATGGYDYASVEAYNFLALCGGNWTRAGNTLLFGISYKAFGTAAILLAVTASLLMQWREVRPILLHRSPEGSDDHCLFAASAFCMFAIFTFGHYMHERYVFPVILLLIAAFVYTGEHRYLLCSLALSAVLFLNEMTAMYVISALASSVVRGSAEHAAVVRVCSFAETALFVYYLNLVIKRIFGDNGKEERACA